MEIKKAKMLKAVLAFAGAIAGKIRFTIENDGSCRIYAIGGKLQLELKDCFSRAEGASVLFDAKAMSAAIDHKSSLMEICVGRIAIKRGSGLTVYTSTEECKDDIVFTGFPVEKRLSVGSAQFCELVEKTTPFTTEERTRYQLDKVMFSIVDKGTLEAIATNGKTLSVANACSIYGAMQQAVAVPKSTLYPLAKLIKGIAGEVDIEGSAEFYKITVLCGHLSLSISGINGIVTFPPAHKVIPKDYQHWANKVTIDRKNTIAALKGLKKNMVLCWHVASGSAIVRAQNAADDDIEREFKMDGVVEKHLPECQIVLNTCFVRSMLNVMPGKTVDVYIKDGNSSMVAIGENTLIVILPIKKFGATD